MLPLALPLILLPLARVVRPALVSLLCPLTLSASPTPLSLTPMLVAVADGLRDDGTDVDVDSEPLVGWCVCRVVRLPLRLESPDALAGVAALAVLP